MSLAARQPRPRLVRAPSFCHSATMRTHTTRAGGLFLMLAILLGTGWGIATGQAMLGVLSGTGAGISIAVLIWLVDWTREKYR